MAQLKILGVWTVVHKDKKGKVKGKQKGKNLITTIGMNYCASRVGAASPAQAPSWISIGSGTNPPAVGNVGLQTQLGARTSAAVNMVLNEMTVSATVAGPGSGTWTVNEVGIHFLSTATGNLIARFLIQQVVLSPGETLEIAWTVRFGV